MRVLKMWVVYDSIQDLVFVDHRGTRKEMKQHHMDTLGMMNWKEAESKGHKVVKATLSVDVPQLRKKKKKK